MEKYIELVCDSCGESFQERAAKIKHNIKIGGLPRRFCKRTCIKRGAFFDDESNLTRAISLYESGMYTPDVAKELGVSARLITLRFNQMSIPYPIAPKLFSTENNPRLGILISEEERKIHGAKVKACYDNNPSMREAARHKTLLQIAEGRMPHALTSIERSISECLTSLGIEHVTQYVVEYWSYDIFVPIANLLIECDGDYWHGHPDKFPVLNATQRNNIGRGKQKDKCADRNGFSLIRFWESDIEGRPEWIRKSLVEFISSAQPIVIVNRDHNK